ncbi:MAG: leucine-rich repeat domain-containing protein, partial [Clostridia bacterium]|nr:leucine-rich repeat domain-containing protein [Clostridia bacterium]
MKKTRLIFTFIMCTLLALTLFSVSAAAEDEQQKVYTKAAFGNVFEYTVENGEATIVGATIEKGDVIIPNELGGYPVKKIGKKAFYSEYKIKSIFIQSGIEEIDEKAFASDDDRDDDVRINLKSLTLPDTLKKIGYSAFTYAIINGELTLPESLQYIDNYAFVFAYFHNKEMFIPKNVEYIGEGAFLNNGFIKYKVDENNKHYSHDSQGALYNKDKTTLIHYPNSTYVAENTTFVIPDTVQVIAKDCFYDTRCLKEIVIPHSVVEIEDNAFGFSETLKKLVLPSSLQKVGRMFLHGAITHEVYYEGTEEHWNEICTYFSSNVEKIHFLYGTEPHEYTESITKAPTCKQMGKKTYTCTCGVAYTKDISSINENHSKYYTEKVVEPAGLYKNGKKEIVCEKCGVVDSGNIPEIRSIYVREKYYYTGKEIKPEVDISTRADISKNEYEIIYPEKAVDVGTYKLTVKFSGRFEGSHEYTYSIYPTEVKNLKSVLSAKGITFTWDKNKEATAYKIGVSINGGEAEYHEVSADTSEWFVPSVYDGGELGIDEYCVFTVTAVTKLSDGAVMESAKVRNDIKFTPEQKIYKAKEGTYTYFILGDEATIVKADVKGNVTVPSKLGGKKVTGILSFAFDAQSKLTSVVIPEGVKSIGKAAFRDSGITKITLPSTLTDIEENAFQYCKKLKTIVLSEKNPSLTLDESGVLYNKDKTE